MNTRTHIPPRRAEQFLQWFIRDELAEEVLGDLEEQFFVRLETTSPFKAKVNYWYQVFNYLRPFAIRKSKPRSYIYLPMYRHNFLISCRKLVRERAFSLLNVFGLAIGIASALIILLIVRHELSFNLFAPEADQIYRVVIGDSRNESDPGTPHRLMETFKAEIPEIEEGAIAFKLNPSETQIEVDEELMRNPDIAFTTPSFFEFMNLGWVDGDPQRSLSNPGQVVITQSLAQNWFKGKAIGKPIRLNNEYDLLVSGIIEDMPSNTDFPVQIAVSYATFATQNPSYDENLSLNVNSFHQTLFTLSSGTDPSLVEAKFPSIIAQHLGEEIAERVHLWLQPLSDIHFNEGPGVTNFSGRALNKNTIWGFALIGMLILLTACINYINLATARAVKRSKEVGIRKVLGSHRSQLIIQFLSEGFLICSIATLIAVALANLFLPSIANHLNIPIQTSLLSDPIIIAALGIGCVLITLMAGYYPAILLSKYKVVEAFKHSFSNNQKGGLSLRRGLVVFQFAITFFLIASTLVVSQQLHFFQNQYMGFDKEAVVTVDIPDSEEKQLAIQRIKTQLRQNPAIKEMSFSLNTPAATINKWWTDYEHITAPDEPVMEHKAIDETYLDLYNIPLLAGQNIRANDSLIEVIINESMMHELGIQEPDKAIGTMLSFWSVQEAPIVGVVKDFHSTSLHQEIHSVMLWQGFDFMLQKGSFRIDMSQAQTAIQAIEKAFTTTFPETYFTYEFLDDELATFYEQEQKTSRLLTLFSFIAIFIGCLGLYGLVSFMAAQKTKEVGIRKVLGASVQHIVSLFTKEFAQLLGIAFLIAVPLVWYFMQEWLEEFPNRIELEWWMFALAGLVGIVIAGITISFQSIRAATANPVKALRTE